MQATGGHPAEGGILPSGAQSKPRRRTKKTNPTPAAASAATAQPITDTELQAAVAQIDALFSLSPADTRTVYETNVCMDCGARLEQHAAHYLCESCGRTMLGGDEDDDTTVPVPVRLRICGGSDTRGLQAELDSTSVADYAEKRIANVLADYRVYQGAYENVSLKRVAGARPIPVPALQTAATLYAEFVQRGNNPHRAQCKQRIMAACLYCACIREGFMPSTTELALFMQLKDRGISSGLNLLYEVDAATPLTTLDIHVDARPAAFNSALMRIEFSILYGPDVNAAVCAAAQQVLDVAEDQHILSNMMQNTRVLGTLYEVLRRLERAQSAARQRRGPPPADTMLRPALARLLGQSLPKIEQLRTIIANYETSCNIRSNTIRSLTGLLNQYHSRFVPTYRTYHLCPCRNECTCAGTQDAAEAAAAAAAAVGAMAAAAN